MFGYVRPRKSDLRVREYELFRAAYCGLCHSLKRSCGPAARFAVNYDFTVLAMLLDSETDRRFCERRCMASPFRKRRCCGETAALGRAADLSLVLLWWKLADQEQDGNFWRRTASRLARLALRRGCKRAMARETAFNGACQTQLSALNQLEKEGCASLDQAADQFAVLLSQAAQGEADPARRRVLAQLFYQLGRFIYIADAAEDTAEDRDAGRYNPVLARFGTLDQAARTALEETLLASAGLAGSALALLDETRFTPILVNILTLGMPDMAEAILREEQVDKKRKRKWRIG